MEHENPPFSLHTRGDRGGRASASPVIQYPFDFLREDETGMIIGPFRKQNSKLCHTMLHIVSYRVENLPVRALVIFAFAIKWLEKQVDPDLASKKSGWSLLNEKFDELLSFVQLIAKRNTDDENQRKEDDKDTSEAEPEGHSNTNATPPRPPTPPKPEGKDSQLDSKIDSLEEKIRLIQGLNSFGNTDFLEHVLVPQHDGATQVQGPGVREIQWERRPHDPSANLKKISHWKELADTFLAQYGFQLPNSSGSVRPSKDGKEEQRDLQGICPKFFVDLIPVGDRIEDALKTKKIVDMTALMALAEQAAKKAPTKRKEGDVQMIGRNNGRPRQAPAPAPAPQMPARPEGNQPNDNRWLRKEPSNPMTTGFTYGLRKEPRQFTPLPMPMTELYPILIEKSLISPIVPKPYSGPQRRDFNPNSACDFHFGEVGHTVENCGQLRHRVQDLIDHGVLKFEGLPNITTNPLPKHPEGGVNMVEVEEGNEESIAWRRLFYTLEKQKHITPLDAPPGPSTGDSCEYHSGARGHSLDCCEEFKKKVTDLMENGIVGREEIPSKGSRQPDDPSDFDWYAEINLDDIVEDEMDLDNLQDEEADWGYFMEDDTDEWRDVDFTEFFQFPCLDSATWYGEKMALHLENELLMISVFPESLSKQAAAWFYQLRNLTGWDDLVIVEIKEESDVSSLPALAEGEEEEKVKPPPPAKNQIITTTAEEEYAGPMVEGLSIHTIAEEEDSTTTPPTRHCQQGEEVKTWTCVPLLQRVSSSNDDILEALERQDEGSKPNIEELEIVNLANEGEEPREVKIGTRCAAEQKEALIALLREFHEDLRLVLPRHARPRHRHSGPQDSAEARMQARFLSTVTYSDWVANIVPVPKKDGKVRMCVDYRDLNRASPKDNFPLPHIDTLVDNTATNVVFSFMDGFSGYNQIKMAEEDKSKTAFVTHWGTFVYDVMPFGLKNAGATYQRAMVTLFHDMIHHEIEVYVDDMIAKSRTAQDHLTDLRKLFQAIEEVSAQIKPEQVQAIRSMPAPKTEKEIRSFLGRINYIARFIAQLTATCEPLFKLLRKDVKIKWTEDCQKAFDKIKEYLLNPPILVPPTPGRPLILYLTVQEASMGCMLGQQDETGKKEQAIYYLSKKFTEPETRYLLVEKTCCALAWASKKLRQYMLYYTTWLVSRMDPIKYIFEKPALTGKIARWQVLLSEFDILFVARKAIKGQAIADYLADYPSEQLELMDSEFPDEDVMTVDEDNQGRWKLYFDGAANAVGSGIGAVLVSPKGQQTPIAMQKKANRLIQEMHAGLMGAHANGPFLARKIMRAGYYWLTMERDCIRHVQTCHKCQMYQNSKNAPPQYLHTMASPWPFSAWGMDVIEACSFKNVTQVAVTRFVKNNIICRYGMPEMLITDNASNLNNRMMDQLCQQFKIQHHNSAPYRPKMNGAVEAANKERHPLEPPPTLCWKKPEWAQARYEQLNFIDEKRLAALCHGQLYQRRIERAYNKKARPRTFQPGDLVLKKRNMALSDPRGKFAPSYEGPYVVKKAFSGGAIILADMDGEEFRSPINSDSVIKYHV
uniref:Integrase catalytic domain-containing protein n=1 Tax=Fagus sylvatica TaxID=28930 RepID=A0A2N9HVR4_FAGSY